MYFDHQARFYSFHFFLLFAEIIEQLNDVLTTKMENIVIGLIRFPSSSLLIYQYSYYFLFDFLLTERTRMS